MRTRPIWLATLVLLTGCGGNSGNTDDRFHGAFTGDWVARDGSTGSATVTFSTNRQFTGVLSQNGASTATISGQVASDGSVSGTFDYSGGSTPLVGVWRIDGDGNLTGTISQTVEGTTQTFTLSLSRIQVTPL